MSDDTDDKAPPKGALEEAVSLADDAIALARVAINDHTGNTYEGVRKLSTDLAALTELERRRAALEPRLAKRRENQAEPRGGKEPK